VAEEFGKLLQLRETLGEAMVVLMVDGELEVVRMSSVDRRNLIAVDGGENLAERLGLVGVKAQPEGAGCLYLSISSWPAERHGRCSGRTMFVCQVASPSSGRKAEQKAQFLSLADQRARFLRGEDGRVRGGN
jgi:hypothetical protein